MALFYFIMLGAIIYALLRGKTIGSPDNGNDFTEDEIVWFFDEPLDDDEEW